MPGQTDNVNFLDAYNQAIVAINELRGNLETGNPAQNLSALVEVIGDNIEALRNTHEARSVAHTTAMNTNFDDLIAALQGWTPVRVRAGGCGCCGGGAIVLPEENSSIEGDPPPSSKWTTPDDAPTPGDPGGVVYYNRKCKISNGIHEDLVNFIQGLSDNGVDTMVVPLINAYVNVAIGIVIDEAGAFLPILETELGEVTSAVFDMAVELATLDMNFAVLLSVMNSKEQELVCAFYNSTGGENAKDSYLQILEDEGIGIDDRRLIEILLWADVYNYIHFKGDGYIEAKLANYTPPVDCSVCGTCEELLLTWGTRNGDTFTAEWVSTGEYRIAFGVNSDGYAECGPTLTLTFFNWSGFTGKPYNQRQGFSISNDFDHDTSDASTFEVENTNTPPANQTYNDCRNPTLVSSTPFTVDITGFSV